MAALIVAVLLDWALGEPPTRWHPVVWIGRLIAAGRALVRPGPSAALVGQGAALVLGVVAITAASVRMAGHAFALAPSPWTIVAEAVLLKCSFSVRRLFEAVELVRGHLVAGDLDGARRQLGLHLVSRRTADLDGAALASGAIESLAENLTDSWVAPVLFFVAFPRAGLMAAWVYRAVNTADAMIGYREGDLQYVGRVAARADDALNLIPARLAALAIVGGAACGGASADGACRTWRRDGSNTSSPNAGQTMAAMAGALRVSLEKRGHYRLGSGPSPGVAEIDAALRVARRAVGLSLAAALLALAATRRA